MNKEHLSCHVLSMEQINKTCRFESSLHSSQYFSSSTSLIECHTTISPTYPLLVRESTIATHTDEKFSSTMADDCSTELLHDHHGEVCCGDDQNYPCLPSLDQDSSEEDNPRPISLRQDPRFWYCCVCGSKVKPVSRTTCYCKHNFCFRCAIVDGKFNTHQYLADVLPLPVQVALPQPQPVVDESASLSAGQSRSSEEKASSELTPQFSK